MIPVVRPVLAGRDRVRTDMVDVKSIVDIAHYVNVLDDGRIVHSPSRDEFLTSGHLLARAFVEPSGVIIPAELTLRGVA